MNARVWPATLHHLYLTTEHIADKVAWYEDALQMQPELIDTDVWHLAGSQRDLVIGLDKSGGMAYAAFALADTAHLERLRQTLTDAGVAVRPLAAPLFYEGAYAVKDPDGNTLVFGIPVQQRTVNDALPGRLQHLGLRTVNATVMTDFYTDILGFRVSDLVRDQNGDLTASFLRSDPEHHSIAIFRAPTTQLDHLCCETTSWNDIRDWGDHLAARYIEIEWGAGRHGAGNNLFIFVRDPDGVPVEFSAELQHCPYEQEPKVWKHEQRTLNLWGSAWMRS